MNKVQIVGGLTRDPESREAGGTTITRFTVACNRRFKKEGQPSADFISCVAFGETAKFVSKYFKKGNRIGLTGRIQTGSYTGKDGNKVYTTDVVAEEVEFVESKASSQQNQSAPQTAPQMNRQTPYLIAERDSVKVNLLAHVRNNLLNETFGICKSRYDATEKQLQDIKVRKEAILDAMRKCETVDDMLTCPEARPYISAAWLDSSEAMIVRKMRNNAIKRFPKNLNSIANQSYVELDDAYKASQAEIEAQENSVEFIEEIKNEDIT